MSYQRIGWIIMIYDNKNRKSAVIPFLYDLKEICSATALSVILLSCTQSFSIGREPSRNNYSLKTQITLLKKFLFKFFSVLQGIAIQSIPTLTVRITAVDSRDMTRRRFKYSPSPNFFLFWNWLDFYKNSKLLWFVFVCIKNFNFKLVLMIFTNASTKFWSNNIL